MTLQVVAVGYLGTPLGSGHFFNEAEAVMDSDPDPDPSRYCNLNTTNFAYPLPGVMYRDTAMV